MLKTVAALIAAAALPAVAFAQPVADAVNQVVGVSPTGQIVGVTLTDGADSGDTAWVLAASALVLLMAAPGLALFYGGQVRARNFLSVAVQAGAVISVASLLWVMVGYTLAFGQVSGGWIGAGNAWMLINLDDVRAGTTVSESTFALFEMGLAAIAPALMIGTWVDRARFGWVVAFSALWSLLVYAPVAHWIWGGGWLAAKLGTVDFAGGIVVFTTAGVSALVVALLMGKRVGFPRTPMLPHAPGLTLAGAALLWVGWFGMNGGSALTASDDAASAILNTHLAACAAALAWLLIENFTAGKPTSVGFAKGALAGLATIAPAAQWVSPGAAILFGALAAVACYGATRLTRRRLEIDDSLGVFATFGVGGMLGALLAAVFMAPSLGGTGYAQGMNMARQLVAQGVGVGVIALWSAVATAIAALMVSLVLPMRVTEDDEREGLDLASHGERAWVHD